MKMNRRKGVSLITFIMLFSLLVLQACSGGGGSATTGTGTAEENKKTESENLPREIVIGTGKAGGAANVMANGLASIITENTRMRAKVSGLGALNVYIDQFKAGEVDFVVNSLLDFINGYYGEGVFKEKSDYIRVVAIGAEEPYGFLVPDDHPDIKTHVQAKEWIKGKTLSHGWSVPNIDMFNRAMLANLGLTEQDIKAFPLTNYDDFTSAWVEKRLDFASATLNAGVMEQLNAGRSFHYISLDDSPEAINRMKEVEPSLSIITQKPGPVGVKEEINTMAYNYAIVTREDVDDAVVLKVLEALYANQEKIGGLPSLENWVPADQKWVNDVASVPFHPAAISFYKEKGLWSENMGKLQEKWLSGNRF